MSNRGLPRSGANTGSIRNHPGVRSPGFGKERLDEIERTLVLTCLDEYPRDLVP